MRWEELHGRRAEFVGRNIQIEHEGKVYRGPIIQILKAIDMDSIWAGDVMSYEIHTAWVAVRDKDKENWVMFKQGPEELFCSLSLRKGKLSQPEEKADRSITFSHDKIGDFTILPAGNNILVRVR